MKNKLQNNKIYRTAKNHPLVTGGGIGTILTTIVFRICGIIDEVNFSQIVDWISKLKFLIQNHPICSIIIVIIISYVFYTIKKLNNKRSLEHDIIDLAKSDDTISDISISERDGNTNLSINREQHKRETKNGKIINYPITRRVEDNK